MLLKNIYTGLVTVPSDILNRLQSGLILAVRLWVAWQFLPSGWLKLNSWDSTLFLFKEEYHVPLVPPELAAFAGTGGELIFSVLIVIGLFGRLSAVGLSVVNAMAVYAYAHVLLSEGFEAALGQHLLWGFMLLVIAVYGPGRISLDYLFSDRHIVSREASDPQVIAV